MTDETWGVVDFRDHFDSFSTAATPIKLDTGGVADLRILSFLNGDPLPVVDEPRLGSLQAFYLSPESAVSAGMVNTVNIIINDFIGLAENGVPATATEKEAFLTPELARSLDVLIKSFKAAGFVLGNPGTDPEQIASLKRWQDISENGHTLENLLSMIGYLDPTLAPVDRAAAAGYAADSMQRMLETGYVQEGTRIIFEDLDALKDQQVLTKEALSILTDAQNLHNLVAPIATAEDGGGKVFLDDTQPVTTILTQEDFEAQVLAHENEDQYNVGIDGGRQEELEALGAVIATKPEELTNDAAIDAAIDALWNSNIHISYQDIEIEIKAGYEFYFNHPVDGLVQASGYVGEFIPLGSIPDASMPNMSGINFGLYSDNYSASDFFSAPSNAITLDKTIVITTGATTETIELTYEMGVEFDRVRTDDSGDDIGEVFTANGPTVETIANNSNITPDDWSTKDTLKAWYLEQIKLATESDEGGTAQKITGYTNVGGFPVPIYTDFTIGSTGFPINFVPVAKTTYQKNTAAAVEILPEIPTLASAAMANGSPLSFDGGGFGGTVPIILPLEVQYPVIGNATDDSVSVLTLNDLLTVEIGDKLTIGDEVVTVSVETFEGLWPKAVDTLFAPLRIESTEEDQPGSLQQYNQLKLDVAGMIADLKTVRLQDALTELPEPLSVSDSAPTQNNQQINFTNNSIDFLTPHGFSSGQAIEWKQGPGVPIAGLNDGQVYYVNTAPGGAGTVVKLATTYEDAIAGTNLITLTDPNAGAGPYAYQLQPTYTVDSIGDPSEGTLEKSLERVLEDMGVSIQQWLIDSWPSTETLTDGITDRSTVQNNLRTAMTAGANLNDEQKEQLRKTLFIFEEFYKSASALLSKITQLIEKIAGNISR